MSEQNRVNRGIKAHEQLAEQKHKMQQNIRAIQIDCEHKTNHGPSLTSVADSKEYIPARHTYDEFAMICDLCKDIFEMQSYSQEDCEHALMVLYSICNQAKVLSNTTDEEFENITRIIGLLDVIKASLIPYYQKKIIKPLVERGNGGRKNNQQRTKGKIGINGSSFNR